MITNVSKKREGLVSGFWRTSRFSSMVRVGLDSVSKRAMKSSSRVPLRTTVPLEALVTVDSTVRANVLWGWGGWWGGGVVGWWGGGVVGWWGGEVGGGLRTITRGGERRLEGWER